MLSLVKGFDWAKHCLNHIPSRKEQVQVDLTYGICYIVIRS